MSTKNQNLTDVPSYQNLLDQISDTYTQGRTRAIQAVNTHITATYWQVGRHIVEFEQGGKHKAEYGKALISKLSRDLGLRHGRGFSRANVIYMRLFYQCFPDSQKSQTLSDQLSWSHIVELLKIDDPLERGFYQQQAVSFRLIQPHKPGCGALFGQRRSFSFLSSICEPLLVHNGPIPNQARGRPCSLLH